MDYSQLDGLMAIPKKNNAAKERKENFSRNILALLSEEGYSANAEKYFFGGFSFCGASPVFEHIKNLNTGERYNFIIKMTKGQMYRDNEKNISCKILIQLLGLFIVNFPQDTEAIGFFMLCIPQKTETKSGKTSNDLPLIIEKYFFLEVSAGTKYPDWETLPIGTDMQAKFSLLLIEAIKGIKQQKGRDPEIIKTVLNWLNIKQQEVPNQTEHHNQLVSKGKPDIKLSEKEKKAERESLSRSQFVDKITALENELSRIKKANIDVSKEFSQLKLGRKVLEEKYSRLETSNELLASEKKHLQFELNNYKEEIASKGKENIFLKEEIEKQKSVLSIYSSDKQNSLNEQRNAIAATLKTHYLNYKDAIEMDMTLELGENLKYLVGDVFKTLAKAGVDVEGNV